MSYFPCPKRSVYVMGLYPVPEPRDWRRPFELAFSALVGPYNVGVQVEDDPKKFINLSSLPVVSLELPSKYTQSLDDFVHPEECVYVTGNSRYLAPAMLMPNEVIHRVTVPLPPSLCGVDPENSLYGFQILPIVLDHRWRQLNGTSI